MNQKRLLLEASLCIFAGILAGIGLAFRYEVSPYIAAILGGLAGALTFRPKELFNLCWQIAHERYADFLELLAFLTIAAGSLAVHYYLIKLTFPNDTSLFFDICVSYVAGVIALLIVWVFLLGDHFSLFPSWKMPATCRTRKWWDNVDFNTASGVKTLLILMWIVFFVPISVSLALIAILLVVVDVVVTVAMFICITPRLAIMWGAALGTLTGCCFCTTMFEAILLGSVVGIPSGLGAYKLRWLLASESDRRDWLKKAAATT